MKTMQELICVHCNSAFESSYFKKSCSNSCRRASTEAKHTYQCLQCEKSFISTQGSTNVHKYCSHACEFEYRRANAKPKPRFTCQHCDAEFERDFNDFREGLHKYCSRECQWLALRKPVDPFRIMLTECPCGVYFVSNRTQKYCTAICMAEMTAERNLYGADGKQIIERNCKHCGTAFTPEYRDRRRVFCSPLCKKTYGSRREKGRKRMHEIMIGGTDLGIADLPQDYIDMCIAYRKLNQSYWRAFDVNAKRYKEQPIIY